MGRVYHFRGEYAQDVGAYEDTPFEKLWYVYGPKNSGVSLGIGSHLLDLARFLVGEIEEVGGVMPIYTPVRQSAHGPAAVDKEEDMLSIVRFANGAAGMLRASAVSAGRKNSLRFEISCSKGSLMFDLEHLNYLDVFLKDSPVKEVTGFTRVNVTQVDRDHPFMDVWWPRCHVVGWEHAHINEIAHFLHCIATGEAVAPHGATFEDGYRAAQIIDVLRASAKDGCFHKIEY